MTSEFNLNVDELEINSRRYYMRLTDGTVILVGKLLKREPTYSYFHQMYSTYNNNIGFEFMPKGYYMPGPKCKIFCEISPSHYLYEKPNILRQLIIIFNSFISFLKSLL
jgi:hypothetical protein